ERHLDPGLAQRYQALAVEHVERLGFMPEVVEPEPAIGQRAVHVEARQPDPGGAFEQVFAVVGSVFRHINLASAGAAGPRATRHRPSGKDQTTRARNRSCTLSAPTTRRDASSTTSALILRVSISRAASTAS